MVCSLVFTLPNDTCTMKNTRICSDSEMSATAAKVNSDLSLDANRQQLEKELEDGYVANSVSALATANEMMGAEADLTIERG